MVKSFVILLSLLAFNLYAQLELPAYSASDEIVKHPNYTLKYNEQHEEADWVAYKLTKDMLTTNSPAQRKNAFKADPLVPTGSADTQDYVRSGFDRGHLCPSADFKANQVYMDETFYMSNMTPMRHLFNSGIWEDLENHERQWAIENQEIFIVSGPVLKDELTEYIGKRNKVAVPKRFYKVILDYKEPELKMIAFVIPHDAQAGDISIYSMTVRDAENITGFDFFSSIPKDVQERLETTLDLKKWGLSESAKRYESGMVKKTLATPHARQNDAPDGVQAGVNPDRAIVYAIAILGVILVLGVAVLVVGIKMNRNRRN